MIIKSIKVQNFQRINDPVTIELGPVTVLIGENGAGKSSVLKAVHWAVRCATLADYTGKVTLDQMDFVPSKDYASLAHKRRLQNNSGGRKIIVSLFNSTNEETTVTIGTARNDAGVNAYIDGPMKEVLINANIPSTAFIPGISGTAEEETILAVPIMHRKAASGESGATLRQIILAHLDNNINTSDYVELRDLSMWVSKVMPNTQFWVKFDRLRDKHIDVKFLTEDMKIPGQSNKYAWKSIDMAGTGFLQVVQIFAYLLYFKPKLLLIDEPDAHLHPSRQQLLISALESAVKELADTQILMTTHSPNLVRSLSLSSKIHWIEDGQLKSNGQIARERMGWNILDKDLIIFSEDGNSTLLQNILNQWPIISQKCLIWPTFGKDALPNGDTVNKLRNKFGIRIVIHRDRDFMSDNDVIDWKNFRQYTQNNIPVWITEGSDIESTYCSIRNISLSLDVSEEISEEILSDALNKFDNEDVMSIFSRAYSDCVHRLPANNERNPIHRWGVLGGSANIQTIKGKNLLHQINKSCNSILPNRGLGLKLANKNRLNQNKENITLASDLHGLLTLILNTP